MVQMGSASKANKILGDVVLLVPEKEVVRKRRLKMKDLPLPPSRSSRGSLREIHMSQTNGMSPHSIRKVEKLRGESLPVESLRRMNSRPKSKGAVWII